MSKLTDRMEDIGVGYFYAAPYPFTVIAVGHYDLNNVSNINEALPDLPPHDAEGARAQCRWCELDGEKVIVISVDVDSPAFAELVAHECYHAMNSIYRHVGAKHSTRNDEPGAYFLGSLVRQVTGVLK